MSRGHDHTTNSSSNNADDHELLGANQEQILEAHASTHDASSSIALPQCRGGVLLQRNLFTSKYET